VKLFDRKKTVRNILWHCPFELYTEWRARKLVLEHWPCDILLNRRSIYNRQLSTYFSELIFSLSDKWWNENKFVGTGTRIKITCIFEIFPVYWTSCPYVTCIILTKYSVRKQNKNVFNQSISLFRPPKRTWNEPPWPWRDADKCRHFDIFVSCLKCLSLNFPIPAVAALLT
jgi:hypothetical protein